MNRPSPRWLAAGLVATSAVIAHAGPAITSSTAVRRRCWPALAGLGDPAHVALTFDDGPDARSTPAFVGALAREQVHATFFVLGRMLQTQPSIGRLLVDAGHEVGLHGWSHRCLLARGPRSTYDDLARGHDAVLRTCGRLPRWYRPPYGVLTTAGLVAARRLEMTPVLWTTWGRDWSARSTPARVSSHVARRIGPGGTVLLHDSDCTSAPESWRSSLEALPSLVADIRRRGLAPGPLRDHQLTAPSPRHPDGTVGGHHDND